MDSEDYAFFLAYGMTQEEEQLLSMLDVEMYTNIENSCTFSVEARNSNVLCGDTP